MFSFMSLKSVLVATALSCALGCAAAPPASAFSVFGFNSDGNASAPRINTPRRFASRPFDGGGNVFAYYGRAHSADFSPGPTVIAGVCASACTMKLGARNACVEPDAILLFHQASFNGYRSEVGTRMMLFSYPRQIRRWVLRTGALNSSSLTALSGNDAIAMGMRPC